MKRGLITTVLAAAILIVSAAGHGAARQASTDEQQALRTRDDQQAMRTRIEQRFDVVPLSGGVALTPKSPRGDVRLVEISDTIAINGVQVSGRELRERLGADADIVLRLSYLNRDDLRRLFARQAPQAEPPPAPDTPVERATPAAPTPPDAPEPPARRHRRSSGDRVRVFGDVVVNEGEEVSGQVVAVLGSVRVNGEVGDQVVAVLGTVDLGPKAIVHGDVVAVGGKLHRAAGARVDGSVTEVALGDMSAGVHLPWMNGWGPMRFGGFGPVTRLIGTTFRIVLLALVACLALVVARRAVEGAAQRVTDEPIKATLVGLAAWVLIVPMFTLIAVVLSISIVGIPLLILLPFALLALLLMAVAGFSGTVSAIGQWARRRFGMGTTSPFVDVCLGILIILLPLIVGRFVAFGGWTLSPIVFLLVSTGLAVEFLVWSSGFGAILTNAFSRWQAKRSAPTVPHTAPTTL